MGLGFEKMYRARSGAGLAAAGSRADGSRQRVLGPPPTRIEQSILPGIHKVGRIPWNKLCRDRQKLHDSKVPRLLRHEGNHPPLQRPRVHFIFEKIWCGS